MTIIAETIAAAAGSDGNLPHIPVDVAVRIIAAGIAPQLDTKGKELVGVDGKPIQLARITLALTPVQAKATDSGAVDLADWPAAIGALLPPGSTIQVQVVPVDKAGGRTAPEAGNVSGITTTSKIAVPFKVRAHPVSDVDLSTYWQRVVGSAEEIGYLVSALGTGKDSLALLLRDSGGGTTTPNIHGSGRSSAAVELSLERARQILERLSGSSAATRPTPEDNMTTRVRDIASPLLLATNPTQTDAAVAALLMSAGGKASIKEALKNIGDAIESLKSKGVTKADTDVQRAEWVALSVRKILEDEDAWKALETSNLRADAAAKARLEYQNAPTAKDAIIALTNASNCHIGRRTPFAVAAEWQNVQPEGPKIEEAHASHRLASRTPGPDGTDVKLPDDVGLDTPKQIIREFARRRFFALQASPSLARLFRFVVDLDCPVRLLDQVMATGQTYPERDTVDRDTLGRVAESAPQAVPARFLFLSAQIQQLQGATSRLPEIWTAAKLRWKEGIRDAHFYPCTREEIDARAAEADLRLLKVSADLRKLAVAEQIDGLIDLGQQAECSGGSEPRFDILTLDAITSTAADVHFEQTRAQNQTILQRVNARDERLPPETVADINDQRRATLRTGGLALADRWRQNHAIARHRAAERQHEAKADSPILLDASDLTIGYKLDVGVKSRTHGENARRYWHTLMRRTVVFNEQGVGADMAWPGQRPLDPTINDLYADRLSRLRADDGVLTVPAALRQLNSSKSAAFAEEIIGAWRGDPLGLATGEEKHRLDSRDLRIGMTLDLPKRTDSPYAEDFTPPPLRFGWRYHFGMRAVFAGGISVPLERALNHYELSHGGGLVLPATKQPGRAFRRHERIDTPRITVPEWAFGQVSSKPGTHKKAVQLRTHFGSEQALRMIVRTVNDPQNRKMLGLPDNSAEDASTSGVSIARRVLMVPPVALDFAGLHDAFRGAATDNNITLFEPRVLRDRDPSDPHDKGDEAETGEGVRAELVPAPIPGLKGEFWKPVRVAWRAVRVVDRPRGGLSGIDHHAAWGGFPLFQMAPVVGQSVKPKSHQAVLRNEGTVTDEGEIVDRVEGLETVVFSHAPKNPKVTAKPSGAPADLPKAASIQWTAVAGNPSGSAVFRPLDASRKNEKERLPYYPDPATASIVIEVRVKGASKDKPIRTARLVAKVYGSEPDGPVPKGYPDALPVVLDILRASSDSDPLIAFGSGGVDGKADYGTLDHTPKEAFSGGASKPAQPIPVRHVVVRLAEGEQAAIRAWCLPSLSFLEHMFEGTEAVAALAVACGCLSANALGDQQAIDDACSAGLKLLCKGINFPKVKTGAPSGPAVGGLATPSQPVIKAIASLIHTSMTQAPLSEISAPIEIEAAHVVDLPLWKPSFQPPQTPLPLLRVDEVLLRTLLDPPADPRNPPPLYEPKKWDISVQTPNATGLILAGRVKLHGISTGAIEIYASGAAAARGHFDDPDRGRSRDDRVRGLWPKPDGRNDIDPTSIFGFTPSASGRVTLQRENVTLLRVEGFTPDKNDLDLLDVQRAAWNSEKAHNLGQPVSEEESSLRAQRPSAFPDGRARHLDLFASAISRNVGLLRTRYDELPERLAIPTAADLKKINVVKEAQHVARQWLPATVRPARVAPQSLIPSFRWTNGKTDDGAARTKLTVHTSRKMSVRVRMRRPWFSSGEGERIGIVLWPPHLFTLDSQDIQQDVIRVLAAGRNAINLRSLPPDGGSIPELQDIDLGPGGPWVSRWGADPIRPGYPVRGALLSPANFGNAADANKVWDAAPLEGHKGIWTPGDKVWDLPPESGLPDRAIVSNALMPIPATEDSPEARVAEPAGGFMAVALLTHEARFDPEQELWYADVDIDPLDISYPFVRVGLVRYQPHAPRKLQTSEPIVEWIQLLPERATSATFEESSGFSVLTVTVKGPASKRGESGNKPEISSAQRPVMRITLLRRILGEDGAAGADTVFETVEAHAEIVAGGLQWTQDFNLKSENLDENDAIWSIFAEEVERMRPGTYPDEPRYGTRTEVSFAETGPRFAAKLELNELWDWMRERRKKLKK
jgi:hypothetical protein